MQYLNKLLNAIKKDPSLFKASDIIIKTGLTLNQIKSLKKYALDNLLIKQSKGWYFLTPKGEEYLSRKPLQSWINKDFPLRPNINLEILKEEKTTPILTKAIRCLARHLLENETLKEFSTEHALFNELKLCEKQLQKLETDILSGKQVLLENIYSKYLNLGLTKPLISILLLNILSNNVERIAIYEKNQFQLKLCQLMFDRMMACPQNFVIQKTEMPDEYILKDVSKIILNKKSNNILEITKGLYSIIKSLDKYTMNTQNLSEKTLRLRNVIIGAKDPLSLFERDIPKVYGKKSLKETDREFLNGLKKSLDELKFCTENLINNIEIFILDSFHAKNKEDLAQRFLDIKDFINSQELKILLNSVVDTDVTSDLWTKRIATYINKFRVPKDWSDEDFADFKVQTKELALKFFVLEATVGTSDCSITNNYQSVLKSFMKLSKQEQLIFLRNCVNN